MQVASSEIQKITTAGLEDCFFELLFRLYCRDPDSCAISILWNLDLPTSLCLVQWLCGPWIQCDMCKYDTLALLQDCSNKRLVSV